jgi:hypothetical protein
MTTNLYQVLYVGPPRYEGSPSEQDALRSTVQSFIKTHGGRRSGLAGVKVGFALGMFIIFADSLVAAQCMPGNFEGFERQYNALEVSAEKVRAAGPFFCEAKVD